LRREYVVIGAHYDHLGTSTFRALDPELGPLLRLGADDNASGTAAVLELARRFASRPARRTVLVANFDAEELGLMGSRVFVTNTPVPIRSIVFMLNLDMVGRLRNERLYAEVSQNKTAIRELLAELAADAGLRVEYTWAIRGRSDHATFLAARVDAVALTTGLHVDYHRVSDKMAFINVAGLRKVVDIAEGIARTQADR
jgi:Zn-dependent M28 family amino/carboxypeptidase